MRRASCSVGASALPLFLGSRSSSTSRTTLRPLASFCLLKPSIAVFRPEIIKSELHPRTQLRSIHSDKTSTSIEVNNGVISAQNVTIPNIWLRDNCQCSLCVHGDTKQRLLDTFKIPKDIVIRSSQQDSQGIDIQWSDGHKSYYKNALLSATIAPFEERAEVRQGLHSPTLWGAEIKNDPPIIPHDAIVSNEQEGLLSLLDNIRKYGFSFIDNVPHDSASPTESLLRRIAFVRETHYGGFYDFTADLASKDTAYTSIALEAHTDNTYFSDPAGLQALHLLSHTEGSGGASLLVDGFKAADDLKRQDPEAYKILSTTNVHAHASGNEGISIQPYRGFPVFQHDSASPSQLLQVRWNSSDRSSIELPISETEKWYDAARKFDALLKSEENEYWEQLVPGRVLLMDNWRVMHGRSSFTGKRRICGAYLNRDDWISKYKVLRWGQEEVLEKLPVG